MKTETPASCLTAVGERSGVLRRKAGIPGAFANQLVVNPVPFDTCLDSLGRNTRGGDLLQALIGDRTGAASLSNLTP